MRVRYALIAIALAVLALAGLRLETERPISPAASAATASHLAPQPAPDVDPPATVRAAITSSAHAPSQPSCDTRSLSHPVKDRWTIVGQTSREPGYDVSRPRTFPLLI